MSEEQKELLRIAVLRVLEANKTRFGLGLMAIGLHLGAFGFKSAKSDELADAVGYLEDKGLVEEALKVISAANRAWRITAKGTAFVDERT